MQKPTAPNIFLQVRTRKEKFFALYDRPGLSLADAILPGQGGSHATCTHWHHFSGIHPQPPGNAQLFSAKMVRLPRELLKW